MDNPINLRIGGISFKVPISRSGNGLLSATVSRTPEWVIMFDGGLTASTLEEYPDFVVLLGFFSEQSRYVSGNVNGSIFTSGSVQGGEYIFILQNGEHGPKLEQQMYSGKNVPCVRLIRLGWSEGALSVLQTITLTVVRITRFMQNIQYIVIVVQAGARTNDISDFNQADGACAGHKISTVNYSENKLEFESQ
ncbi:MAG: hypothetical protein LBF84_03220 [Holosporales bacterium]|jgi:hypothetical protein|nr:hypothetical protein [Holosporales bacterium]